MMLSSGAIRSRIGTIVESLCRTAVTEISKIVEDGMMVLRLETCYRESEIKRLKGDIARLQVELRAAQEAGATARREHGARVRLVEVVVVVVLVVVIMREESWECCGPKWVNSPLGRTKRLKNRVSEHKYAIRRNNMDTFRINIKVIWRVEGHEQIQKNIRENLAIQNKDTSSIFVTFIPTINQNNQSVSLVQSRPIEDRPEDQNARPQEPPRPAILDHDPNAAQNANVGRAENSLPHLANSSVDMGPSAGRHFGFNPYSADPKKEKICPYCGKCFERSAHLERHKMIHTGEKPFQCETCGRCFNQKCSLKEHRKIHIRDAQLALQHSSGSASGSVLAPKPTESIPNHSLNHSLKPEDPQQSAPVPVLLAQHQDISFHLFPNASGCAPQFCIKDGNLLDLPKRAPRPKKMYPCPYCPKVFWRSEHLERHVRIHTGEKPYGCYICGRFFSQTSSLKGHMKTHINIKIRGKRLVEQLKCMSDKGGVEKTVASWILNTRLSPPKTKILSSFRPEQPTGVAPNPNGNVKLEPKEEPLDPEYGDTIIMNMNQEAAWNSGISLDQDTLKAEEMDLENAQINIEMVPNSNHCSDLINLETGQDEDDEDNDDDNMNQNGNDLEFKSQTSDCAGSDQGMSSYICSVCGESYDNFNLFQKHQCLEQLHSDEI
ncbi:hypothetical protein WMY93_000631 [Mugilogobius chulae]|uniref:C2H2-type domain-containing protein n=1 Tax=Mugilogobius chulae TaxID=88201 RepID=A0AAW0Q0Y5_9GOBI